MSSSKRDLDYISIELGSVALSIVYRPVQQWLARLYEHTTNLRACNPCADSITPVELLLQLSNDTDSAKLFAVTTADNIFPPSALAVEWPESAP